MTPVRLRHLHSHSLHDTCFVWMTPEAVALACILLIRCLACIAGDHNGKPCDDEKLSGLTGFFSLCVVNHVKNSGPEMRHEPATAAEQAIS